MWRSTKVFLFGGLLIAVGLALFVSPWASGDPDGLNRVAIDKGFDDTEKEHAFAESPVAGYSVRGVRDERIGTALSGLIGVLITFGFGTILFGAIRIRRKPGSTTKETL